MATGEVICKFQMLCAWLLQCAHLDLWSILCMLNLKPERVINVLPCCQRWGLSCSGHHFVCINCENRCWNTWFWQYIHTSILKTTVPLIQSTKQFFTRWWPHKFWCNKGFWSVKLLLHCCWASRMGCTKSSFTCPSRCCTNATVTWGVSITWAIDHLVCRLSICLLTDLFTQFSHIMWAFLATADAEVSMWVSTFMNYRSSWI